jgi:hypothetical protein
MLWFWGGQASLLSPDWLSGPALLPLVVDPPQW